MFKRWIQTLLVTISLLILGLAFQSYFSYLRYQDYSVVLNNCSKFEDISMQNETVKWTAEEKIWYENTCNHENKYSVASTKYLTYRTLSENNDMNMLVEIIGLIFLVSLMGRWVYSGSIKW